jgi:hypothetical protein
VPSKSPYNLDWFNLEKQFTGAVCIPSICNANELVPKMMEKIFNGTTFVMTDSYNQENFCQVKRKLEFDFGSLLAM